MKASSPYLDRRKYRNQKNGHIRQARALFGKSERWSMGARLVKRLHQLYAESSDEKCRGWAAVNRGGLTRTFYVAKGNGPGIRRGDKVFRKKALEHHQEQGVKFRQVRYPANKRLMSALKDMAAIAQPLHHEAQFGFVPHRDCMKSAARHAYARTVFLLDFENAFDQVSEVEVYGIFRRVFLVNDADAKALARLCCYAGHLYQGNPMAPVIFNLRALRCVERLNRLCESKGATLTVYADDVTISHPGWEYFSARFRKAVYAIIHECGLSVNPAKCKVRHQSMDKVGSYDITGLVIDYDPYTKLPYVRAAHRRLYRRKAAYVAHLQAQGYMFSNERCKDGTPKKLNWVEVGLRGWAERQPEAEDYPPLRLPFANSSKL